MLRSLAKDTAAQVASWTHIDVRRRETPYIIGYHRVVDRLNANSDFALPAMETSVPMLEKHLEWLGRHFEIVSLDQVGRRPRSKPLAAVTFDDGYGGVYHNAFSMLKRKGIPAAFFVVTDLVGTDAVPLHDRVYAALARTRVENPFLATQHLLRDRSYDAVLRAIQSIELPEAPASLRPLTWDMLAEMRDAGMAIGSHSKTHAFLTNENPERVRGEVHDSRLALQQHLGIDASFFAYPGGDFNARIVQAVGDAGYKAAFTICRHRDERYPMLTIRRRGLWERSCIDRFGRFSPSIMSCHAAAMFGRASDCPKSH